MNGAGFPVAGLHGMIVVDRNSDVRKRGVRPESDLGRGTVGALLEQLEEECR
jgi:hypothetical protein